MTEQLIEATRIGTCLGCGDATTGEPLPPQPLRQYEGPQRGHFSLCQSCHVFYALEDGERCAGCWPGALKLPAETRERQPDSGWF